MGPQWSSEGNGYKYVPKDYIQIPNRIVDVMAYKLREALHVQEGALVSKDDIQKKLDKKEIRLETETARRLFSVLKPYIEEAGYTITLTDVIEGLGIDVTIE